MTTLAPSTMSVRERFQAVMNFQPFDRLPILEWAIWWNMTLDRWRKEGLPARITNHAAMSEHFGLDLYLQDWISPRWADCPQPPGHGAALINSHEEYERLKPKLYPPDPIQAARWQEWAVLQKQGRAVLWFTLEGFFWFPRWLLGVEGHFYAMYDQPELIHRINSDLADWHIRMIEKVGVFCRPDFMTFAEDMSYNQGPMLSEELFNTFLQPYYKRVIPRLQERGVLALIDSDGDITKAMPWFERAGLQGVLPLERHAGVDVSILRQDHPAMRFIGHFDKLTMSRGEAAMRQEFERLLPTARQGGLLISCDHQTPPEVSYNDYLCYLALFREYALLAGQATSVGDKLRRER
ncbi:MAG: hypothetical protein HC898_02020 [Phycisphaerales bacterium]|nr:hypothetical protein [Phycisphaerales bacterium]